MHIEIRKLTPDLAEDYVRFFDTTPHNDEYGGRKCYCVTWRSDTSYASESNHWFEAEEERRSKALQFVRDGSIQGYLAYYGGRIVGWCNANENCRLGLAHLRSVWPMEEDRTDIRVKSIFCFVVAPEMKRLGVATKLLEHICKNAAAEGFAFVEAYVNETFDANDFRGPLAMYEKCGFTIYAKRKGKAVMRKALH